MFISFSYLMTNQDNKLLIQRKVNHIKINIQKYFVKNVIEQIVASYFFLIKK